MYRFTIDTYPFHNRGTFDMPPLRNLMVGNIIKALFKWPCKYRSESNCEFEGSGEDLDSHEEMCKIWKNLLSLIFEF